MVINCWCPQLNNVQFVLSKAPSTKCISVWPLKVNSPSVVWYNYDAASIQMIRAGYMIHDCLLDEPQASLATIRRIYTCVLLYVWFYQSPLICIPSKTKWLLLPIPIHDANQGTTYDVGMTYRVLLWWAVGEYRSEFSRAHPQARLSPLAERGKPYGGWRQKFYWFHCSLALNCNDVTWTSWHFIADSPDFLQ